MTPSTGSRVSPDSCRRYRRGKGSGWDRADLRYTNGFALRWQGLVPASAVATQVHGQDMNRKGDKSLIVGLDIGTSKVVALVGEYSPGNPIEVIGIGTHESRGLKRGVVVDIESTVQSIQRAIEEAELMAGCEIRSVYVSISGNHVQCRNSPGIVPIRDGEVSYADLDRVLEAAKAGGDPGRPEDPACDATGICDRRSGWHSLSSRHDWRATGSARASGFRAAPAAATSSSACSAAACRWTS